MSKQQKNIINPKELSGAGVIIDNPLRDKEKDDILKDINFLKYKMRGKREVFIVDEQT